MLLLFSDVKYKFKFNHWDSIKLFLVIFLDCFTPHLHTPCNLHMTEKNFKNWKVTIFFLLKLWHFKFLIVLPFQSYERIYFIRIPHDVKKVLKYFIGSFNRISYLWRLISFDIKKEIKCTTLKSHHFPTVTTL